MRFEITTTWEALTATRTRHESSSKKEAEIFPRPSFLEITSYFGTYLGLMKSRTRRRNAV
jgi:hypothetical protein